MEIREENKHESKIDRFEKDIDAIKKTLQLLISNEFKENKAKNKSKGENSVIELVIISVVIIFLIFLFILISFYLIYKMNDISMILGYNAFGRYKRPNKCYACYRPWRHKKFGKHTEIGKPSFSSPELMDDYEAPIPEV